MINCYNWLAILLLLFLFNNCDYTTTTLGNDGIHGLLVLLFLYPRQVAESTISLLIECVIAIGGCHEQKVGFESRLQRATHAQGAYPTSWISAQCAVIVL